MIWRFIKTALVIGSLLAHGSWTHGIAGGDVICNFITGVAIGIGSDTCVTPPPTCDGSTNTQTSFDAFTTWATGTWQASHTGIIELYIPPGTNCSLTTTEITFSGIKNLLVSGYGATLSGTYYHLGGGGQYQNNLHSTRLLTANKGDTSVTVNPGSSSQPAACNSNATCTALFTVGGWALVAGFDLQFGTGFPSNPAFFQYVHITAINSSTGVITFDSALTDTYKSTWPNYSSGDGILNPDDGGPATLYAFTPGWNMTVEWRGITFNNSTQKDASARQATFKDVTFNGVGNACFNPTMTRSVSIINSTMTNCTMEFDKMVESASFSGLVIDQFQFQSANKNVAMSGVTVRNFIGTPANLTLANSTVTGTFQMGPTSYGRTDSVVVTNSSVASVGDVSFHTNFGVGYDGSRNFTGSDVTISIASPAVITWAANGLAVNQKIFFTTTGTLPTGITASTDVYVKTILSTDTFTISATPGGAAINTSGSQSGTQHVTIDGNEGFNNIAGTSMSGGVYIIPNSYLITYGGSTFGWDTPGTNVCWADDSNQCAGPIFQISDVTQDATNTYVTMNAPGGGYPSWAVVGHLILQNHPAPKVTFTNVTGDIIATMLSDAAAAGRPLYSYWNATYVNADTANMPYYGMWGNLTKMVVNVTAAYAGIGGAAMTPNALFGNWFTGTPSITAYTPAVINLKVAGIRTLDATGGAPANWSGAQSGDTLTNLSQALWSPTLFRSVSTDLSGDPGHPMSVNVLVTTNQNLVLP